ncbi:MAG: elongation factor Ts [Dehalococcoidales bacterium]|nr:elongation factor Ts [Dehalococcoidales bacterium]
MKITADTVKTLREQSGAGVMECRNVLAEADGDIVKAVEILKGRSLYKAEKKKERATTQGLVEAYIHSGGRIGAMVELSCETDFVARTNEFKQLAHDLAMQIAAMSPKFITKEEIPAGSDATANDCLTAQPFIKCADQTIQDLINQTIAKVGENIQVKRFARFEVG